jgi:hypothetical protein
MMAGMYPLLMVHAVVCPANVVASFANEPLPDDQVIPHLSALIQTYLSTMSSIGAETWIMHGTLLSWWWNQKVSSSCPCPLLTKATLAPAAPKPK